MGGVAASVQFHPSLDFVAKANHMVSSVLSGHAAPACLDDQVHRLFGSEFGVEGLQQALVILATNELANRVEDESALLLEGAKTLQWLSRGLIGLRIAGNGDHAVRRGYPAGDGGFLHLSVAADGQVHQVEPV